MVEFCLFVSTQENTLILPKWPPCSVDFQDEKQRRIGLRNHLNSSKVELYIIIAQVSDPTLFVFFFRKITDKILYYETNLKKIKEVSTHWNENQSLDIFVIK